MIIPSGENRLLSQPMPKVLLPLAAGICAAEAVRVGGTLAAILFVAALGLAVVLRRSRFSTAAVLVAVGLYGFAVMTLRRVEPLLPEGGRADVEMVVTDRAGEWCEVRLVRMRVGDVWRDADERANLRIHGANPEPGDIFAATITVRPFVKNGYGRLLLARGISATGYAEGRDMTARGRCGGAAPGILAARLRIAAAERLGRLGLTSECRATVLAMTLGERSGLDRDTKRRYAASGAAHVLAVSGLHVGIVFMLVNFLLFWLPLFRYGPILRAAAAVVLIWLYAAVTGFAPSAVRAACMFTGLQTAVATSRTHESFNVLCGTAAVMLGIAPAMLFDVSFLMSFVAVAAITLWLPPLYAVLRCGRRWIDALWGLFLVGAVCTVALAPLTASVFGRVSLAGIFLNPVVILTANVVIFTSLLWIVAPLSFAAPLFRLVLEAAARVQNGMVDAAASVQWGSVETDLAPWAAACIYVVFAALTMLGLSKTRTKRLTLRRDDSR